MARRKNPLFLSLVWDPTMLHQTPCYCASAPSSGCLGHRAADCRGLFLGRANVHGLAALDDGSATVDAVKGAADAVGGDMDVGYA